jgi:antitoxin CptB
MTEPSFKKRLAWQCRRGMLELDVILIPFLEQHFEALDSVQQDLFAELLQAADPDLYTWLMGFGQCPSAALADMVCLIQRKMLITNR